MDNILKIKNLTGGYNRKKIIENIKVSEREGKKIYEIK